MAKKTKGKPKKRTRVARLRVANLVMVLIIGISVGFGVYEFWHQHIEAGQYRISDTFIGENLFDSLDLKLAAKATYPSQPVQLTQDLGADNGVKLQHFSFKAIDDRLLEYGLVTLPNTPRPAAGYPTLILLHGFSSPRDYNTDTFYLPDMEFYSEHGFAVFKPDFRGQGLSVNSGHPNSPFYSMDYNTDVMSLISALKQSSFVDRTNISIWGHSMGGYVGLRAAVLSPDIKNLIVLSGPVDSLAKMYATYVPTSDSRDPYALKTRNEVFSKYHTPDHDRFWTDSSPIYLLPMIKAKVQIHVGLDDHTVPPEFSADLNSALTGGNIPHQYFTYPDGSHSLRQQRDLIWSRSLQLLTGA